MSNSPAASHLDSSLPPIPPVAPDLAPESVDADRQTYANLEVIKRNGALVAFDPEKIRAAIAKAYVSTLGEQSANAQATTAKIAGFVDSITEGLVRRAHWQRQIHIEDIQDKVELTLMNAGEHQVSRNYVLYRERHAQQRAQQDHIEYQVRRTDSSSYQIPQHKLEALFRKAADGIDGIDTAKLCEKATRNLPREVREREFYDALIMATTPLIEEEPDYAYVASRLLREKLWVEAGQVLELETPQSWQQGRKAYASYFIEAILFGRRNEQLNQDLANFDLRRLARELRPERDDLFLYQGTRILYDRYLQHHKGLRYELPQVFFMRVAMGLALQESDPDARAIEFYHQLSSLDYMTSTPTLFNSGTCHSQLSSCYISTVPDDLDGIFEAIQDNAMLSKWAGGLGNDWTPIRGNGAWIKGTNGQSNGVLPFLKVANATTHAVNQGGKRNGALCAYLEVWHRDIEFFIEQRKNTGDERLRNHELNIAAWIPDLFMQRVEADGDWTLFSPDETPDLHDLYGRAFADKYEHYERQAQAGEIHLHKQLKARKLWQHILGMLYNTGHPWITFKDPCNVRSPQQHCGVVHSSNLCTEITLNTSKDEIAVCNLGSVNLAQHVKDKKIDYKKLRKTVRTAVRMLDNVIDINYYPIDKARNSNQKHRPVGLGTMGYQDALFKMDLAFDSQEALEFTDNMQEAISYYAIEASADLAAERGRYPSYEGSLWSQGVLPIDSLQLLAAERGSEELQVDTSAHMDWEPLRAKLRTHGMRNSNVMAIAPTATIAKIVGVYPSVEPMHANLYVETNKSGNFYVINRSLVSELKRAGLWSPAIVHDLKYFRGSIQDIAAIPAELRFKHKTSFEVDMRWVVEAASRRQKWIDQSQSINLFFDQVDGDQVDSIYRLAWRKGLKTTYYLRSKAASAVEQSTTVGGHRRRVQLNGAAGNSSARPSAPQPAAVCDLSSGECEACS